MRIFILALSVFFYSCGKIDGTGTPGTGIGESRPLSLVSQVTTTDRNNIASICNSLLQKEAVLSSALNSVLTFFTTQTDCSGNTIESRDVEVLIQSATGGFAFKRKINNQDYIFPNVETTTSGVFSEICAAGANLQNPIVSTNGATYFTTSGISPTDCPPVNGEICILIENGSPQDQAFVIHTKEWIRIRTNSTAGKIGFFTERKKVTKSICGQNEVLTFRATLK